MSQFRIIPRRKISLFKGEFRVICRLLFRNEIRCGKYVEEFERRFAGFIGADYAVAVSSGSEALAVVLRALRLPVSSEIILPAYTDEGVLASIEQNGYRPCFVDIDEHTFNMDERQIESKINARTKAILATHIFGLPCNVGKILEIARRFDLAVIEDCAHAIGAEYGNKKAGSFGECAIFSFAPTKPFNTFGGGMVVTSNKELYTSIQKMVRENPYPSGLRTAAVVALTMFFYLLTLPWVFLLAVYPALCVLSLFNKDLISTYNKTVKHAFRRKARNGYKFTNMQAAIGIEQLSLLEGRNRIRKRNALALNRLIEPRVMKPGIPSGAYGHVWYFYVMRSHDKHCVVRHLLYRGIDTGKYLMRNCAKISGGTGAYPVTEKIYNQSIQIPVDFTLTERDMEYIAGAINAFYK